MKKLSIVLFVSFMAGCIVGEAQDPLQEDLPSAGATEEEAITPDDPAFYSMSEVVPEEPDAIATDDSIAPELLARGTRGLRAIVWYKNHRGISSYEGLCELAAELSFGTRGRYASAIANWNSRVRAGAAHKGDRNPPAGALVFWRTSVFGHVAVADGVGGAWSTSVGGSIVHVSRLSYYSNYLGWAWAPPGWPGR